MSRFNSFFQRSDSSHTRRAFSLIELIVVIFVLALLTSLIGAALTRSRAAARAVSCQNNQRQIALAMLAHESRNQAFPLDGAHFQSFLVALLPDLEQSALYDVTKEIRKKSTEEELKPFADVLRTPPIFQCPDDSLIDQGKYHHSYRGSTGTAESRGEDANTSWQGVFRPARYCRLRDITDGASNTVMISEQLVGPGDSRNSDVRRYTYNTPRWYSIPEEEKALVAACNRLDVDPIPIGINGFNWLEPGHLFSLYNHVNTPNTPPCLNRGTDWSSTHSASSQHTGFVIAASADGRAERYSDTIDINVWRQLGTTSGADAQPF